MKYFLDTNIILAFLRQNKVSQIVNNILSLTDNNQLYVSVVTIGERWSIARQNQWATAKQKQLRSIVNSYFQLTVSDEELILRYADIDAFSQNKIAEHLLGVSARNMVKNGLWIAASTSLEGASLITTDKNSDHLHGQFVDVIRIDPNLYR